MNTVSGGQPRYHLRFQVIPGPNAERDARALARFCTEHGVEEVVLFFAAEEWNNGLLSADEEDLWFDTVKRAKGILDSAGIAVSLNPWMTVLHTDRGRRFPVDCSFKPMVSPLGETSQACASFADTAWRRYVWDLYGRFAALGFRVIWVEDDFRYHNHAPLTWGGGFEPEVLERFARKVGRNVTRREVVAAILKPGEPHPWRALWMETWREIQLEVARGFAEAIAEGAPGPTRLGLMSSHPSSHSAEGRDWHALFDALSINGKVAHRPHYAAYGDSPGKSRGYSIMMLDVQRGFRPADCEVAPEVENFPFTAWNKSDSQTWSEMALCMFYGSDALLLDLFPFSGNPADEEPQIGGMLDRSRPALEWIAARFPKGLETRGVGIPWKEDAQAHVRTGAGRSLSEWNATSFEPGNLLLPYGVPVSARPQPANAVFGSLAWAFDDEEVLRMLSGGLLLDGASAEILHRRGFAEHIGVEFRGWANRDESAYSLEVTASEEAGVRRGLYFNANTHPRLALLEPQDGAVEWTTILTPTRERLGSGMIVFENALGGRVVMIAAPNPAGLPRSYHRQTITQNAVRFLGGGTFAFALITGGPDLMPMHFEGEGMRRVVVFNGSPDPARPVVRVDGARTKPGALTVLAPLSKPVRVDCTIDRGRHGITVVPQAEVPYHGYLVVEW